ncbi:trans-resveratrol di-O-methyltransferase-like [Cucurbita moschata]|uniref:Trans-resveratrol di-O-methyltransferase-like n=1 Tax=Cucurbita moschata TaxID=3662 RepID=A0A6J1GLH7_CUCMO|nr:trans-resveratrol di-O-methyltransferase-like [Cucurbita moschata]
MDLEGAKMGAVEGDELLEAQSHIWNHILAINKSMALKYAVQVGIPDIIHRYGPNPMPLSKLVSALQLHPQNTPHMHRLMRVLVHSGFFRTQKLSEPNGEEDEGYVLTNSSRLLVTTNPLTLAPFVFCVLESAFFQSWRSLPAWLQTEDRTPFDTANGVSFWECLANDSTDDGVIFNKSMASDAKFVMRILLEKYKDVFDGFGSLVDVGGGTGNVVKAIAQAFPKMECTVFDLPQVVGDLKGEANFKYVQGDMFHAIPPADAILLKWILHDWNDEECVKILKNCKEAITGNKKNGKVIVIDMVVGNDTRDECTETQLFFDMMMMLMLGGKERDEKEWAQLIKEAGYSGYKIFPILGLRSLVEIYP